MKRRDFLRRTTTAGLASLAAAGVASPLAGEARARRDPKLPIGSIAPGASAPRGLLYPQQNSIRNLFDLSGIWQFQTDPDEAGEANRWFLDLPSPRPIAVPSSWNDLFDDARDYLGLAWYRKTFEVPSGWRGQRIFLRVGSANYSASVWVNGTLVAEHQGGHLPFIADISAHLVWDSGNVLAIGVENKQLPERVPPGASVEGGGVAGAMGGFPATTYDFFPYAGLHRPVVVYSVPAAAHIDDVTVVTELDGGDGLVTVKVATGGAYGGAGKVRLGDSEAELSFQRGSAEMTMRIPSARRWGLKDPYLYPLTVSLTDAGRTSDLYTLDIGIRTIEVRGDRLLLNGEAIRLTGFGKHEDFPVSGRGLNLPVWIRDYELLRWIGANSYRTSHYPYSEEAMQLADQLGVLVINEIPAVGLNFEASDRLNAARLAQCRQQLQELIARDKNHPSTILWSVANEPMGGWSSDVGSSGTEASSTGPRASRAVGAGMDFFRQLVDDADRLDGTRPVTLVGVQGGARDWHGLFDVVCVNAYHGWYSLPGQLERAEQALARDLDELHRAFGKPVIVTEFGADTLPGTHNTSPEMWTEEYQLEFLRAYLDVGAQRPFVAGMHVWNFADFKTSQGAGRPAGMNFKGVFTRDRRPKMAAHFLRSRWRSE